MHITAHSYIHTISHKALTSIRNVIYRAPKSTRARAVSLSILARSSAAALPTPLQLSHSAARKTERESAREVSLSAREQERRRVHLVAVWPCSAGHSAANPAEHLRCRLASFYTHRSRRSRRRSLTRRFRALDTLTSACLCGYRV